MLNIVIIALIVVGLIIHRYLTSFWEQELLPYSMGFLVYVFLFVVLYLINFIWIFGILTGIILSVLSFLQIIHSSCLWIFLLPSALMMQGNLNIPKVNLIAYSGWSFVVLILGILTIANFFVSPYQSGWEYFDYNYKAVAIITGLTVIIGNIARICVMSKFVKTSSISETDV